MEMQPIKRTTESMFSEAATAKMLAQWQREGYVNALYNAAILLNTCMHQQRCMTQWLAGEAARNLGKPELENDILQDAIIKSDQK